MRAPISAPPARPGPPPVDPSVERMSLVARQLADAAAAPVMPPARWGRLQIERARRARGRRRRTIGAAVALPLLVATGWGVHAWLPGAPDVRYRIEGAAGVAQSGAVDGSVDRSMGYIHDVGAGGARLRFTDGTVIDLAAGARAWVVSRGPHGARLRLESGRAHFDVVHRPGARWGAEAGPFAVEVTGTAFDVTWAGADEELEVDLWRGSVEVRGPLIERGIALRSGQRLRARGHEKKIDIEDIVVVNEAARSASFMMAAREVGAPDRRAPAGAPPPVSDAGDRASPGGVPDAPPAAEAPGRAPAGSPAHAWHRSPAAARGSAGQTTRVATRVATPESRATSRPASWPARVAAGDFRGVLDEAQAAGFDRCAADCSVEALTALADAARYAGRSPLARSSLLALRTRFPGSPSARAAAFLLGRMTDDERTALHAGGAASTAAINAAVEWYDRYLDESSDGAFGPEALARKMLAVEALGDHRRASRLAVDYLRRYPRGAYMAHAAALLRRRP